MARKAKNVTARITPPCKWHGAKTYLAARIWELVPKHLHRVHPYGGAWNEAWNWPCEGYSEVYNDINGHLANFFTVLREVSLFDAFLRRVGATQFNERDWIASGAMLGHPPADPVLWAWAFFVRCRQSLAGRMKAFAPLSRTRVRRQMNEQTSAWLTAIEGLPEVHERLKRVAILNQPALKVIKSQDGPGTFYYLDPPYVPLSRSAPDVYAHEMSHQDHAQLLNTLTTIKGKFALSGYRCDLYDNYAEQHNWRRVEWDMPNNAASGSSKKRATECLWMNY